MARIRSIKPETPRDAKLAKVSRGARLTFLYLWTQADDEGWFTATPRSLLGDLYPHDADITEPMLVSELDELRSIGLLHSFDTPDGVLGRVVNFKKHQKIDHPSKSYLATLSREARETFAKGVLSPESRVLSREQDKTSVAQGATRGSVEAAVGNGDEPAAPPPERKKSNLPARRSNALEAVKEHFLSIDEGTRAKLATEEARRWAAEVVFAYWCHKLSHPKALFDEHRERPLVKALLANRDNVGELLYAVDGAASDEWASQELKRHDIPVLFRDRTHIEKYLTTRGYRDGKPHPLVVKHGIGMDADAKVKNAEPIEDVA